MYGADAEWGRDTGLLADLLDLTAHGNWQRGGDPKAQQPDPYPRPAFYSTADPDDQDDVGDPDDAPREDLVDDQDDAGDAEG